MRFALKTMLSITPLTWLFLTAIPAAMNDHIPVTWGAGNYGPNFHGGLGGKSELPPIGTLDPGQFNNLETTIGMESRRIGDTGSNF